MRGINGLRSARWCVALLAVLAVTPLCAQPELPDRLRFLNDRPELRDRLLGWEQEAPPEVVALIRKLRSNAPPVRHGAARAAGEMGPAAKGAIPALMEAWGGRTSIFDLHRPEGQRLPDVATRALAGIGEPAVEPLIAALEASFFGHLAARALGEIGDPRAVGPLLVAASGRDRTAAVVAAEAARVIVDRVTLEGLVDGLANGLDHERREAAAALGRAGDPEAIPPLVEALEDPGLEGAAAEALWQLLEPEPDPEPLAALVAWAATGDDARFANRLCWGGSLAGHAAAVLPACNRAVELDPDHGGIHDSRGLARALTGDAAGAVEDFRVFLEWGQTRRPGEALELRREWIRELEAGGDPFASALETLRLTRAGSSAADL